MFELKTSQLFVIGGFVRNDCEVFDLTTNKFTLLKQPRPASRNNLSGHSQVITIGSKIFVFCRNYFVSIYDFENNKWSIKDCEAVKNISHFACVEYPL